MKTGFQQPDFQACPCERQSCGRLFQKFKRFAPQRFGNTYQAVERNIVFGAFDPADICPVQVGAFGERFLRQAHFLPERPHIFRHPLAILVIHVCQVWLKKARSNIDVSTIEFNTRQSWCGVAKSGLLFPKRHRKRLDETGSSAAELILGKMHSETYSRTQMGDNFPMAGWHDLSITPAWNIHLPD